MRVVTEIPHPQYKLTVFAWNNKYLLKVETPMYEQTYKIGETDLTGDDDIKSIVADEEFMQSVMLRFNEMNESWKKALEKVM